VGGFLVRKFVKPTKVFCSWPPLSGRLDQILPSQTQSKVWTTATGILRESNAAVGQELSRLDSLDRGFDQPPEFLALFVGDSGDDGFVADTAAGVESG